MGKHRTKKITHLALYLPSLRGGGAERVMVNLANGFAQLNIKTDLVLAHAEGPYLEDVSTLVNIIDLNSSKVITSLPGLVRYLKNSRPEAILSTMSHANIIAILARKLARMTKKTTLIIREANTLSLNSKHTDKIFDKLMPLFTRLFYPSADAIVANSIGSAKNLSKYAGIPYDNIRIIANPLNIQRIREQGNKKPVHPWFHNENNKIIVSVGRLEEQKGFDILIKAFAVVKQKNPAARLMVIGEGDKRTELENLVYSLGLSNTVSLPGFVVNPYSFMNHAAMFVLSSRWEGLPNALLEALALGVPVVATDCPSGPAEILENGQYGKLVPVDDYKILAKAILETLDNPIGREILQASTNNFSLDKILDRYLSLLFSVKAHE